MKKFLDDRVCGKTDLYLSGHDHACQWFTSKCGASAGNPGTELIVSGCAAATTTLPGTQPTYVQSIELGFFYIDIQNRSLTGTFVGVDGGTQYTRTLTK